MPKLFQRVIKRAKTVLNLFKFLWRYKMWWLIPIILILILIFLLIILGQATPLGPFIYPIF